jgi:hypothetical protein
MSQMFALDVLAQMSLNGTRSMNAASYELAALVSEVNHRASLMLALTQHESLKMDQFYISSAVVRTNVSVNNLCSLSTITITLAA